MANGCVGLRANYPSCQGARGALIKRDPGATPYSVFGSTSVSGAPLPAAQEALKSMDEHKDFYGSFKQAGTGVGGVSGPGGPGGCRVAGIQVANMPVGFRLGGPGMVGICPPECAPPWMEMSGAAVPQ